MQPEQSETPPSAPTPQPSAPEPEAQKHGLAAWIKSHRLICTLVVIIVLLLGGLLWAVATGKRQDNSQTDTAQTQANTATETPSAVGQKVEGLQLDPNKDYGDTYADGVLPVGDNKYATSGAKKGYLYACEQYAQNLAATAGGAGTRGPWFVHNNTEYDLNKKISVQGKISWHGNFSNKVSGDTRTITTNDLPLNHTTGLFPIASGDPAHMYDANPNSIASQSLTYALDAHPAYGNPSCVTGEVGIMLTGVAMFSGLDAGGRDAGAWEVQDGCEGHPQSTGEYHYHTLSSCIKDTSVSKVIGFALDGYPITGPKVGDKNYLTTADLDTCHGIVSEVTLDGKNTTTYHYVLTQDYPYSVSCYRGTAIQPPGQHEGGPNRAALDSNTRLAPKNP